MAERRDRAGEALRDSERRLALALEATRQGLYDLDVRTGVAAVTPSYLGMIGEDVSRGTIDLATFGERIHPDDAARVSRLIEAYTTGEIDEYRDEFRIRHASGEWVWVLSIGRVIERDETGRAVRVLGSHTDITERKIAEEATARERALSDLIIDALPGPFFMLDERGRFVRWNTAESDVVGIPPEDLADMAGMETVHPDDRDAVAAGLRDVLVKGFGEVEARVLTLGGPRHYLLSGKRLVLDGAAFVVGTGVDLTEREAAAHALVESRRLLEQAKEYAENLIETANAVVVGLDSGGSIVVFNRAAEEVTGYSRSELEGRNWFETVVPRERYPEVWEEFERLSAGGRPGRFENPILTKSGEERYIAWSNSDIVEDGSVTGTISFGIDITERARMEGEIRALNAELERRVEQRTAQMEEANAGLATSNERLQKLNEELIETVKQLEEANRQLDAATRSKNEFLANMSHELRTPLNSVIGFSGVMLQGTPGRLNEEQTKQLTIVNNAGRHLLTLINEVLDLAKIEVGRIELDCERLSLTGVITEVVQSLCPTAEEKGVSLIWAASPEVTIDSDRVRLQQILLNLVGNAVKFTDAGSVTVALDEIGSRVRIAVSDTGCGIASEELERIFEDFYQVKPAEAAKSAGTGLGLSLSRRLARMLGGDIKVASRLGGGSTFTVEVPKVPGS